MRRGSQRGPVGRKILRSAAIGRPRPLRTELRPGGRDHRQSAAAKLHLVTDIDFHTWALRHANRIRHPRCRKRSEIALLGGSGVF